MLVNQGFCIFNKKHVINIFTKINVFYFWWKDIWGSEVGGPVVKGEIFITMNMWGEKITFIFKEQNFFSFLRVAAGKLVEWGVGREPVKLWKNEKM